MIRTIAFVGFAAASLAAGAADIQKCADPSGRITYQDSPCTSGHTIGAVPRESAKGDPEALRQLERERARIARAADAQLAAGQAGQPIVAPMIIQSPSGVVGGTTPGGQVYTAAAPVVAIDPSTGQAVVVGATQNGQTSVANTIEPSAITPAPGTPPGAVIPSQTTTNAITSSPGTIGTLPAGTVVTPNGTIVSLPSVNGTPTTTTTSNGATVTTTPNAATSSGTTSSTQGATYTGPVSQLPSAPSGVSGTTATGATGSTGAATGTR